MRLMKTTLLWPFLIVSLFALSCSDNGGASTEGDTGNPWRDLRSGGYLVPFSPESDGRWFVTFHASDVDTRLLGAVAYTRLGSTEPGNQPAWPTWAFLLYGADWYDLSGWIYHFPPDAPSLDNLMLRVIGPPPTNLGVRSWPIALSVVPRWSEHRSFRPEFIDNSCERITRIEGEFAGDITIHVEPAGPECDRIPYTVRYVAQEIFRR